MTSAMLGRLVSADLPLILWDQRIFSAVPAIFSAVRPRSGICPESSWYQRFTRSNPSRI